MTSLVLTILASFQREQYLATQPPLMTAVSTGDADKVKTLLKNGENPNSREVLTTIPSYFKNIEGGKTYPGESALSMAVSNNRIKIVTILLDAKADVNIAGEVGFTPLMEAARTNNLEMLKLLLHRGAKPNQQNGYGETAIIYAANMNLVKNVETLINAGASMNGGSGSTALMTAAQRGAKETVKLLLKRGADPNIKRPGYPTCLELSYQSYDPEITEILRKAKAKGLSKAAYDKKVDAEIKKLRAEERPNRPLSTSIEKEALPEDIQVIEAVAKDIFEYRTWGSETGTGKGKLLLIESSLSRDEGQYSEGQLDSELDEKQSCDLNLAIRKSYFERNMKSTPLPFPSSYTVSSPLKLIKNLKAMGNRPFEYLKQQNAQGWVSFNCPGYSTQGDRAMVRFSFGPTAHGARGTYLMSKTNGTWTVVWRDLAHYA